MQPHQIADVLTRFRLWGSLPLFGLVVGSVWWNSFNWYALALYVLLILSDAADGWAARKWPRPYTLPPHVDKHKEDNDADFVLSVAVIGGFAVKAGYEWLVRGVFTGGTVAWLVLAVMSAVVSLVFLWLVKELRWPEAERVDVAWGFFYGGLLVTYLLALTYRATNGDVMGMAFFAIMYGGIGGIILVFKRERLMSRLEQRANGAYTGTKSVKQLFGF